MQSLIAAVLLLSYVTPSAATTKRTLAASKQAFARRWLDMHPEAAQDDDQLGELKIENPGAYTMVRALLTKQKLGLLDPKHPTASFAPAPSHEEDQPSGVAAFAKFMKPGEIEHSKPIYSEVQVPEVASDAASETVASDASVPYTQVGRPGPQDWLNWRPAASAADNDATAVQNILGAVAELKQGPAAQNLFQRERSASSRVQENREQSFPSESPGQVPMAPEVAKIVQVTPSTFHKDAYLQSSGSMGDSSNQQFDHPRRNHYLDALGSSQSAPKDISASEGEMNLLNQSPADSHQNRYLSALNTDPAPTAVHSSSSDSLMSLRWNQQQQQQQQQQYQQQQYQKQQYQQQQYQQQQFQQPEQYQQPMQYQQPQYEQLEYQQPQPQYQQLQFQQPQYQPMQHQQSEYQQPQEQTVMYQEQAAQPPMHGTSALAKWLR